MKVKTFFFASLVLTLVFGCASEAQKNFEGAENKSEETYEKPNKISPNQSQPSPNIKREKIKKTISVIDFSGAINKPKSSQVISYIKEAFLTKNVNEYVIYINSDGGDGDSSIALYQSLKALPILITTVNTGAVSSGAVWFYCSGSKRYAMPNTSFMVHGSTISNATISSSVQLEGYIKLYKKFYEAQKDVLKLCSSMNSTVIDEYVKSSDAKYLTVDEAKKVGIVQEIGSPVHQISESVDYIFNWIHD